MSCGKDDDNNGTPVPDPEGTVTANISEDTRIETTGGYIRWIGPDNFHLEGSSELDHSVSICDLGEMKGLGNIANIPQTGYSSPQYSNTTVACESGHGYVVKFEIPRDGFYSLHYVRLYVVEPIISTLGGIMGAKVKYQYPFESTSLSLSKETLSFGSNDKNTQTVDINTDATNWTYYCPYSSWINVDRNEKTLSISVMANEYVLERTGIIRVQANEQLKEIIVTQDPITKTSAPYSLGNIYCENGVTGIVYKVTDNGYHGMILSLGETQCKWSTGIYQSFVTNLDNGMDNMNAIKQLPQWDDRFTVFKWCDDLNRGTITGWYLPALNELSQVYAGYKVARDKFYSVLLGNGGVALSNDYYSGYYWSSSGYIWKDDIYGYGLNFNSGENFSSKCNETRRVRAVHAF
jgi:hypothetical protein